MSYIEKLLDNAACCSQDRGMLDDGVLRKCVRLNVAEPLIKEHERLTAEYSALKDATLPFFTWVYNQGYGQGHHDTVEGMYTDVHPDDNDEYHDDIVKDLLAEYARTVSDRQEQNDDM